jgi:alkylated DNA repair dioxygenase AlkB
MDQRSLLSGDTPAFAAGYAYQTDFLAPQEESELVGELQGLAFAPARYKQYLANRRVVSYGGSYDFSAQRLEPGQPIAPFLHPLRARAAAWGGCAPGELTHALIAEYPPGAALGWHRDVADFELVVGISLLNACRMRFRRYPPQPREKSLPIELEPRSIYRLAGAARWEWQHALPPVPALRYSITFRTLRRVPAPRTAPAD